MNLSAMYITSTTYGQSCQSGTSYSHEFSDLGYHTASPGHSVDLSDDAASEASLHGIVRFLAQREASEAVKLLVQSHEDLVSEVKCLRETLARVKSALDQSEDERNQLQTFSLNCSRLMISCRLCRLRFWSNESLRLNRLDLQTY